jgi:hypothetical protein
MASNNNIIMRIIYFIIIICEPTEMSYTTLAKGFDVDVAGMRWA